MPPDDSGEKTEAPTQRRRDESRRKGQVARSMDLSSAIILAAAMGALNFMAAGIFDKLTRMMNYLLDVSDPAAWQSSLCGKLLRDCLWMAGVMVLPLLGVIVAAAVASNLLQVGWMVSAEPLMPSFNKINPLSGLKRMFSMRAVIRLVMSLGKISLIGIVCWVTISSRLETIVSAAGLGFKAIVSAGAQMVFLLVLRVVILLVILAILDYMYQKWQNEQELKMSRQEVKEDLKRMEGDPHIRAQRQRIARQLAMQRMATEVPKSTVVVTNPTHFAVAIQYEDGMHAPKILAKGADFSALRIKQIAAASGVPIVERKPLARALYKNCKVGDMVPENLYKAVAEVLAYVYSLSKKKTIGRHIPASV